MKKASPVIYVPALRLKQGEYKGLQRLALDIADKILPRLVLPPPKERDPELNRILTKDEIVHETGRRIAKHWPLREALLEPRHLFTEFGEEGCNTWLPRIFEVARNAGAKLTPIASLDDAMGTRNSAFRGAIEKDAPVKLALLIKSGEINSDLASRAATALYSLGIDARSCSVLADFSDADFSNPSNASGIAQAALEDLQAIGDWCQVIFQGTNYPDVNPAATDGEATIPRNEWLAWEEAIQFDANSSEHLIFGDYCADCAVFEFRKGGGIPIRHYRYTTSDGWLVVRGKATGSTEDAMADVCQRILRSGKFAGRHFSSADDYIFKTAKGWAGPGNGTTWREINTAHHITHVVRDIGRTKGMVFHDAVVTDPMEQMDMLSGTITRQ